jgi:hypothetical protein
LVLFLRSLWGFLVALREATGSTGESDEEVVVGSADADLDTVSTLFRLVFWDRFLEPPLCRFFGMAGGGGDGDGDEDARAAVRVGVEVGVGVGAEAEAEAEGGAGAGGEVASGPKEG